ncbi:uncharacterized protein LOC129601299 [Paramacrobiotus metropolitanus]|uniref:uncharacterized protein LOC129601299 n=1 Tax=Paramacrobiotus metropolitanus TaxID=2943436 RepID=UPI0024461678|nr:uncharacterized protein LOC129601299 [Paramacrobiotus metropolitanus]
MAEWSKKLSVVPVISSAVLSLILTVQCQAPTSSGNSAGYIPTCPPDSKPVCLTIRAWCDPRFDQCPGVPAAQCVVNCDNCGIKWYLNGQDVSAQCQANTTVTTALPTTTTLLPTTVCPPENSCPAGTPVVQCFVEPCRGKTCAKNSYATCCNNYCGGCNAYFYDNTGKNVTATC